MGIDWSDLRELKTRVVNKSKNSQLEPQIPLKSALKSAEESDKEKKTSPTTTVLSKKERKQAKESEKK